MESKNIYIRDRSYYFNDSFVRVTIGHDESFAKFLEADKQFRLRL